MIADSEASAVAAQEKRSETSDATAPAGLCQYLFSQRVIAIAIAFFTCNYVLYFLLSWLPSYLVDYQHLDIKDMSIVGAIPWLGAAIGLAGGGTLSDWAVKLGGNPLRARKTLVVVGLVGAAAAMLLTTIAPSTTIAVSLITLASIFSFLVPQTCWVLVREVVPGSRVGATGGFVHLLANLAGVIAPGLTGWTVQHGGGYPAAFGIASGLSIFSALVIMLMLSSQPNIPSIKPSTP